MVGMRHAVVAALLLATCGSSAVVAFAPVLAGRALVQSRVGSRLDIGRTAVARRPLVRTAPLGVSSSPDMPVATEQPSAPEQTVSYGESTKRSLVKALVWRLTAGLVTFVSSLYYSGSLSTAISIVGGDFLSKAGFMFVGERLWSRVQWGQGKKGDSAQRSLAKAVIWRVIAASNTLLCGTLLAKNVNIAAKIAGTDTIIKTALFFVNERAWARIEWGKQYNLEFNI
jgi:uncharacterized membrane protein